MSSQHTRTPTASTTTSFHNHHYRSFHYPSASNASIHSRDPVSPLLPSSSSPVPWAPPRSTPVQNDAYDLASASPLVSPIMSRSPSVADSDRYSTISGVTGYWPQNPDNVSPAAAYVAPFGAVQVVNEHRSAVRARRSSDASVDEDDRLAQSKAEAQFSPQALTLINHFLDQLLYSFLSTAKSTNLHALRPAVTEVLRHRLAKEAVANADEELQELLAGGEEDEERNALAQVTSRDNRKWDLELVWKRTRLRVMVYMRLGEMEDDDEERFVKEQELFYGREMDSRRFSSSSGLVSWSAAIFLTSVLEYVAEQSLQAAGSAAYARSRRPSTSRPDTTTLRQVKVEDFDVEKLALDARLGRLWRTWRKTTRNDRQRPMSPNHHRGIPSVSSFTRDRAASLSALRRPSTGHTRDDSIAAEEQYRAVRQQYIRGMGGPGYDYPETDYPEHVLASNIPLPMRDAKRDVDEIEVPGLAKNSEDDNEEETPASQARRYTYASPANEKFAASMQQQAEPKSTYFPATRPSFALARQRSQSMPTQPRTPNLEIPGAFPSMPDSPEIPRTNLIQEATPEHKANALGLQDINHEREEPKVLLNDVSRTVESGEAVVPEREHVGKNVEPTSQVAGQETDPSKVEAAKEQAHSFDQPAGLLTGVAAGATAVAGAALAAAGLSHYKDQNGETSRQENFDQPQKQLNESPDVSLPRPRDRSSKEIEELDSDKSLVDLKYYIDDESGPRSREGSATRAVPSDTPAHAVDQKMLSNNGFIPAGAIITHQLQPHSEPVHQEASLDPTSSTAPQDPSSNGLLSNREVPLEAASTANAEDPVSSPEPRRSGGHSRQDTATIAALEAPASPSETSECTRSEQKARDMPMIGSPKLSEKPGRLIINGDSLPSENKLNHINVDIAQAYQSSAAPKSPREFLKSRDLSSDSETPKPLSRDYAVQSPNEQTRATAPRPVTAASLASEKEDQVRDLKTVQSAREQTKNESPRSRGSNSDHQKQNSRGEVQDHPAIQGMATPKREKFAIAVPTSGTNTPPAVTSASIRGPEDFDNFLQGGDTVKYTLTPETVRDQQSRPTTDDSKSLKRLSQAASLANASGQTTDGVSKRLSQRKESSDARSSKHQSRASRSQSVKDITAVSPQQNVEPQRERRRSISKPAPRNLSTHRRSGLMAREPQVMTASTRDFADFIRSTGPDREQEVRRIHTSRSVNSLHSTQTTGRSQSVGAGSVQSERERTKSMTHSTMVAENIPPVPKMPGSDSTRVSKGPALQARSATGAASGNKDLINFIRDGPEEEGAHRISRSVAPFRNTMDSDQFGAMGDDFASPAPPSKPSTDVNGVSPSHGRSTSNTPVQPPPFQPTPVQRTISSTSDSTPAPRHAVLPEPEDDMTRKRYRNKDPYALPSDDEDDDDDDDEDFLTALPRKSQRPKEESLVDFLRNNEPPTNNAPRPISNAATINKARQSTTTPTTTADPPAQSNPSPQPSSTFSPSNLNSTPRPPPPPPTVPKLEARGAGAPRKAIPRGNAGARLGAYQQSNTGDLADFLRSSGPTEEAWPAAAPKRFEPPPLPEAGSPSPLKKERKKSFFSRFRKEKV